MERQLNSCIELVWQWMGWWSPVLHFTYMCRCFCVQNYICYQKSKFAHEVRL